MSHCTAHNALFMLHCHYCTACAVKLTLLCLQCTANNAVFRLHCSQYNAHSALLLLHCTYCMYAVINFADTPHCMHASLHCTNCNAHTALLYAALHEHCTANTIYICDYLYNIHKEAMTHYRSVH